MKTMVFLIFFASAWALAANPYRLLCGDGLGNDTEFLNNPSLDVQKNDSQVAIHVWGETGNNLWFIDKFLEAAGQPRTFIEPQSRYEISLTVPFSFDNGKGNIHWYYARGPFENTPSFSVDYDSGQNSPLAVVPVRLVLSDPRGGTPRAYSAYLRFRGLWFEYDEVKRFFGTGAQGLEQHRNASLDLGFARALEWNDSDSICRENP